MQTIDLRRELRYLYAPSARQAEVVDVLELQLATISGTIEPGHAPGSSPAFQAAMEALYGISYTLKFMLKGRAEDPVDYPVMALEALWWVEDGDFDITVPDNWCWTAMIVQPDVITPAVFAEGLAQLRKKRGDGPALADLRLERWREGLAVQIMHIGPYSTEMATIARLDAFAQEHGYRLHGKHHEIYLGDPRRAASEKLKTILRHPVEKKEAEGVESWRQP